MGSGPPTTGQTGRHAGPVRSGREPGADAGRADGGAFEGLYQQAWRPVAALGWSLTGSRALGEELAQDAFLAAYRDWARVGTLDDPGAWVRRAVSNRAVSLWRREGVGRAKRHQLERDADARQRLEGADHADPGDDEFWAAVRDLPARQAQCVALHYLEDRAIGEIAEVLECRPATVRVHLHRGRKALAAALGDTNDSEPKE